MDKFLVSGRIAGPVMASPSSATYATINVNSTGTATTFTFSNGGIEVAAHTGVVPA